MFRGLTRRLHNHTTFYGSLFVHFQKVWALFGGRNSVRIPVRWVPEKITAKLSKTAAAMKVYRGANGVFGRAAGLSILLQVNVVTFYWMLAQSLSLGVPYFAFYTIVPLAIFIMMVPISINGIGLRETAFVFLLGVLVCFFSLFFKLYNVSMFFIVYPTV